jgi:pimeloyl-ACP methyl ester carboxylesterase
MAAPDLPIVLIHGLLGSLDDAAIHGALAPRPSLAPELLGYGELADVAPDTISIAAQVAHVHAAVTRRFGAQPVCLVGHSVGGVVANLLALQHPDRVATVINVEGNFTLRDAFWSASLARMELREVEAQLAGWRADPAAWLARSQLPPTPPLLARARAWLALPATTLQAVARSVVVTTGVPAYLESLRQLFARTPVHLVAGERSRAGWDVPDWASAAARSVTIIPGRGHLMMLEDGPEFGRVLDGVLR